MKELPNGMAFDLNPTSIVCWLNIRMKHFSNEMPNPVGLNEKKLYYQNRHLCCLSPNKKSSGKKSEISLDNNI